MDSSYHNASELSSITEETDIRRFGALRRSQVESLASRRLRRQFAITPAYAKLVAELQGYSG